MGYGIGALVAPLIANPYLENYKKHYDDGVHQVADVTQQNATITGNSTSQESSAITFNVYKAYIIVSTYTFVLSLMFCIIHFYKHCSKKTADVDNQSVSNELTFLEMINPATCADGDCCFGVIVVGLLFFYYFGIVGAERIWGTFIRSYSIDEWKFSGNSGSYINTAFWISFSFGRFSGFVVSMFVPIKIIMICESLTFLLTSLLLLVILPGSTLPLWILTIISGLMNGPMYPTGVSWANIYLNMTGVAITLLVLGAGLGGYTITKLIGHLYDVFGPQQFVYLNFSVSVFILIIVVTMTTLITFRKHIFQRNYVELKVDNNIDNTLEKIEK